MQGGEIGTVDLYRKASAPTRTIQHKYQIGPLRFPPYSEYATLNAKAESLPDIVHLPFEDSTSDVKLIGWEDDWFGNADFNVTKWGNLSEAKIDFVYTCKP